jgi:hypothetical protein
MNADGCQCSRRQSVARFKEAVDSCSYVGRGGELGYASPGDVGISAGDLYGAPAGARTEGPFLGPTSDLYDAGANAGAEVLFNGPASDLYGAGASAGVEVLLLGPASDLSGACARAGVEMVPAGPRPKFDPLSSPNC